MVSVRFFDGDPENGQPVGDVEMDAIPQIGSTACFDYWDRHDSLYRVIAVEYRIAVHKAEGQVHHDFVGVFVSTKIV